MIDFNVIEDIVIENKMKIPQENENIENKLIIFILNEENIIYIGKTDKNLSEYIIEKSNQFQCTHYYTEGVCSDKIDNIIAELILKIQPSSNQRVPSNTKFITNTKAKELYHISKNEFRRYWNESEGLKFRKTLFLEKKIFDDIFAIPNPFSKNMPTIGTLINSIEDVNNTPIDRYGQQQEYFSERKGDGTFVETIQTTYKTPIQENFNNLQKRLQHVYSVVNILDAISFEAYSEYKDETRIFNASDKSWMKTPSEYERDEIIGSYFESLNK